jgi:pseudouridine-5'-phosphate glycosidase
MDRIRIAPEVAEALGRGAAVVALETSVVAHGLPAPENLAAARSCADAVRHGGAVPATIGLIDGQVVVGVGEAELERLGDAARRPAKAGARDLAALLASRRDAGTTVSATMAIAARVGIRVLATGGIGGVHRLLPGAGEAALRDVSADLEELARSPVCVVSAGPKAILDLPATAEVLETLGVPVIGWRTGLLPAFFTEGSGVALDHRVEGAAEVAELLGLHWGTLGRRQGVLLAVAPPEPLPRAEVEEAIERALAGAARAGIAGPAVTPWLLAAVAEATGGRSRVANLALLARNAAVAAEVAVALGRRA